MVSDVGAPIAADTQDAIDFFDRHGNNVALRRGVPGVREYVREILHQTYGSVPVPPVPSPAVTARMREIRR